MAEQDVPASPERGVRYCTWCGAPNPLNAQRCASCGSWLASDVRPASDDEAGPVIDVTGDEPRVVPPAEPLPPWYSSARYSSGRGLVIRGWPGCLLASIALVLFVCGQCVLAYYILRWIF